MCPPLWSGFSVPSLPHLAWCTAVLLSIRLCYQQQPLMPPQADVGTLTMWYFKCRDLVALILTSHFRQKAETREMGARGFLILMTLISLGHNCEFGGTFVQGKTLGEPNRFFLGCLLWHEMPPSESRCSNDHGIEGWEVEHLVLWKTWILY